MKMEKMKNIIYLKFVYIIWFSLSQFLIMLNQTGMEAGISEVIETGI